MNASEGVYGTDYSVNVFSTGFAVVDTLFSSKFIWEQGNMTQMLQLSLFSCSYTTDGKGNMFVAIASPDSYEIQGWNLAGENFTTISREFRCNRLAPPQYCLLHFCFRHFFCQDKMFLFAAFLIWQKSSVLRLFSCPMRLSVTCVKSLPSLRKRKFVLLHLLLRGGQGHNHNT